MPEEVSRWSVDQVTFKLKSCSSGFPSLFYEVTLMLDGEPSVYGNSTERGSFLIGIGAAGSKHRLLSDMLMLFERLVDENRFTEEEAGYVRENKDAFLAMCIAPLAQGAHLYVDYSECVVAIVKALSKLTGHKIWIPVANRRVDD